MRLYDMEKDEWKVADFQRGEHWRSKQVYKCGICGSESNEFQMGGWPSMGPRLYCPGKYEKSDLHDLLQKKVVNSRNKEHPKRYIEDLLEDIEELRQQFKDVPPNVKGIEGEWEGIYSSFG